MKIIVPIGISGSGKSTMYNNMYKDYICICPDNIRLKLTGDISDQSKNGEVFEMVDKMVEECIKNDVDFFYDATNVNTKYRKQFVKAVKKHYNVNVVYVYLPANVDESYKRIRNDIKLNVVRSNVPEDVLKRQYNMYMETLESDWKAEGADEAILINDKNMELNYKINNRNFTEVREIYEFR